MKYYKFDVDKLHVWAGKNADLRMFQRVKCGQILRILSADVTGKVRRCGC